MRVILSEALAKSKDLRLIGNMRRLSSLNFTVVLLVAFLLLTFWGVLAQANAESAGFSAALAVDRFFDSFFIWALGVVPLPAFKSVAVVACVNVIASMMYRLPRGWKSAGLWLMHVALLVLLAGGIAGSGVKREYNGFAVVPSGSALGHSVPAGIDVPAQEVKFFDVRDSLVLNPVGEGERILENRWPYYVQGRGSVEMAPGKHVAMYKAFYDPFHLVPYVFMALFLLGAAFHYVVKIRASRASGASKNGASQVAREPRAQSSRAVAKIVPVVALVSFSLLALPVQVQASARPYTIWEALKADSPVMVDSVVRPFNSFARGFLDDLSGRVTYKCREGDACCENLGVGKVSAGNVVRRVLLYPEKAKCLAVFKVLRSDVAQALQLPPEARYVNYAELEPSRDLLELYASRNDDHPATAEMRRLYSNVLQYESVVNRTAFTIVAGNAAKADSARRSAEVLCHLLNFALWSFVAAFLACMLASLNLIFKKRRLDVVANGLCIVSAVILAILFALRAYVAVRPPMSSLYEIVLLVAMLLMAFEAGAFAFCKNRTYSLMVPVSALAAVLLFFAKFVLEPGDVFRPIPAVLNSSVFLTVHVFTIALGFAGMILSGVVSHLVLFRGHAAFPSAEQPKGSPLYSLMYGTLVFGAVFTIIGTLLGGVWADYAWGRFWGFDPKECGALFVILWALLLLHLRAGRLVNAHVLTVLNCFSVIVTFLCWFGVNLLGVGLHSYGFQNGTALWLCVFVLADALFIGLIARLVARHPEK